MRLAPITELTIIGIASPGIPNEERILIRPTEPVNLAQFGILLTMQNEDNLYTPIIDNFFWFGELIVEPPCWLNIYTGIGQFEKTTIPNTGQIVYSFHWGRRYTVFSSTNPKPILIRMDALLVGQRLFPPNHNLLEK